MKRPASAGYAMLAALLVMTLAATFALVVVGAVLSTQAVERSDAAAWRADALAARAVAGATEALRWRPDLLSGSLEEGSPADRVTWRADWLPTAPIQGVDWPRVRVDIAASAPLARRTESLGIELRTEPWATGVVVAGDAEVDAPLVVSGSGVYVGGALTGRENVGFAAGAGPVTPDGRPADGARGELYPAAAVHAGSGIFSEGAEIHSSASGTLLFPSDTDCHGGQAMPTEWLAAPSSEFLLAAGAHAASPGAALDGARLDLPALAPAASSDGSAGRCLVMPAVDEVSIAGAAPAGTGRLLIVVPGDAVLGGPGEPVAFAGGLVVRGRLLVLGDLRLDGSLYAERLTIAAPARVSLASDWRNLPLAGACRPTLTECAG